MRVPAKVRFQRSSTDRWRPRRPVPALTGPAAQLQARIATLGVGFAGVKLMQPGSGPQGRARRHCLSDIRRQLRDWPYLGSNSQEHPGCRYFVCEGLLIVYQVEPDTGDNATAGDITILAVFGAHQGRRELTR
jgi:hypothetical protein